MVCLRGGVGGLRLSADSPGTRTPAPGPAPRRGRVRPGPGRLLRRRANSHDPFSVPVRSRRLGAVAPRPAPMNAADTAAALLPRGGSTSAGVILPRAEAGKILVRPAMCAARPAGRCSCACPSRARPAARQDANTGEHGGSLDLIRIATAPACSLREALRENPPGSWPNPSCLNNLTAKPTTASLRPTISGTAAGPSTTPAAKIICARGASIAAGSRR